MIVVCTWKHLARKRYTFKLSTVILSDERRDKRLPACPRRQTLARVLRELTLHALVLLPLPGQDLQVAQEGDVKVWARAGTIAAKRRHAAVADGTCHGRLEHAGVARELYLGRQTRREHVDERGELGRECVSPRARTDSRIESDSASSLRCRSFFLTAASTATAAATATAASTATAAATATAASAATTEASAIVLSAAGGYRRAVDGVKGWVASCEEADDPR